MWSSSSDSFDLGQNVDMDEQGTCVPCMVISALDMSKNGSPPGSYMEFDLSSACVLNTFIGPEQWLEDRLPR